MSEESPEGWAIATLGECVDVMDHLRVPVNSEERKQRVGTVPYYGATGQVGWIDDYLFDEELVLLGEDGAPFLDKSKPIAYIIKGRSWVNNHAHVLRARGSITSNVFVKHALDTHDFHEFVNGTTRLKLTQASMVAIPVPLPPVAEQRRILAKVEALLAQVNAARERLAKVPTILKRFRQAVLAAACSGRLTQELGVQGTGLPDSEWRSVPLRDVVVDLDQGWSPKCELEPSPSPDVWGVIKTTAVQPLMFLQDENKRLPTHQRPRAELELQDGDLLITRAGPRARAGICCVVHSVRRRLMICDKVYRFRAKRSRALGDYLTLALNTPAVLEEIDSLKTGISDSGVNLTQEKFLNLEVPIPSLAEQRQIITRVNALFAVASAIEKRVGSATSRAERLPQAILTKAFSGELVPTEAELARAEGRDYESASLLLERIHVERDAARVKRSDSRGAGLRSRRRTAAG